MPKKAQDFLVDSALGEKSFEVKQPANEERITLTIDEGTLPISALKNAKNKAKSEDKKSIFARLDDMLRSLGSPGPKDKATFFRLLSIMINAGIPLIKALDTIADQTVNHKLKKTIFSLARDIEKGGTLSDGMQGFTHIFNEAHVGMVRSGEASGQLNSILKQLAIEVEKAASIIRKVRGAMMYPAFIVVVMIAVISVMMVMVVPKISEVFSESGQTLPLITRIVVGTSDYMNESWPILVVGIFGLIAAVILVRRTKRGRHITDWILIKMPLFGPLLSKSILARFSRSLSNLLGSGVPIIQGLLINSRGLGNEIYRKRVELAAEDISRGIPLGESLRDSPEFPAMMVQMIAVGEQTAQLDNISAKIAEYYEDEVDTAVAGLSKVIEPVILVVVGVVVGGIVAAVMMPIIQLSQISGGL